MKKEFDFSDSLPNKYAIQLRRQQKLIPLDPDAYKVFNTSEKVNNALRAIISAYPKSKKSLSKTT